LVWRPQKQKAQAGLPVLLKTARAGSAGYSGLLSIASRLKKQKPGSESRVAVQAVLQPAGRNCPQEEYTTRVKLFCLATHKCASTKKICRRQIRATLSNSTRRTKVAPENPSLSSL
jgi:hypothetical protein